MTHELTERPRSVLLATPSFSRDGGVASHVASSAAALADAGFEVTVAAARGDRASNGVAIHQLPELEPAPDSDGGAGRFTALVEELHPDIVHFHDLADPALISVARAAAPTVASVHGYAGCAPNTYYFAPGHECQRPHGPMCIANMTFRGCAHSRNPRGRIRAYRAAARRLDGLRAADRIVVYSQAVARNLERNHLDRWAVVPLFSQAAPALTEPPPERRILFAGRIVAAKGLGVLLDAAKELDCTLDVHGDGWWLTQAREQAARAGIADRVVFRGWTDEQTLARAYDECRVVALPSLWPEPFGLVGIEAMSRGRAVVAADTGGVREWLVDGETGRLVPPGDAGALGAALEQLLDDYDLCAQMGRFGAARSAELFSPATHVRSLERVYDQAREHWSKSI